MVETGEAETQSQRRPKGGLALFVLFCAVVCAAALVGWPDKLVDGLEVEARALLDKPIGITWIVGVPALLILERIFAVDLPDYRDPAVVLSIFYSLIATPVLIVTVALFLDWQNEWVTDHVAIVDLEFFQSWHPWAIGLFAFVTSDFLLWITHVIMHRVPVLWRIHEVHHSPATLNMFAADRSHPGETVFRTLFSIGVIALIGPSVLSAEWISAMGTLVTWWLFLVHANLRLGLGPLRYVLVTPQSHRVHHSTQPDHWDSNYGFVLSIWDWIFRTQNADYTTYPETGIGQPAFPVPASLAPREMATAFAAQMAWPFRKGGDS